VHCCPLPHPGIKVWSRGHSGIVVKFVLDWPRCGVGRLFPPSRLSLQKCYLGSFCQPAVGRSLPCVVRAFVCKCFSFSDCFNGYLVAYSFSVGYWECISFANFILCLESLCKLFFGCWLLFEPLSATTHSFLFCAVPTAGNQSIAHRARSPRPRWRALCTSWSYVPCFCSSSPLSAYSSLGALSCAVSPPQAHA